MLPSEPEPAQAGGATPPPAEDGQAGNRPTEAFVVPNGVPTRGGHRQPPPALSAAPNPMGLLLALRRRWVLAFSLGLVAACAASATMWCLRPVSWTAVTTVKVALEQPKILFNVADVRSDFGTYQRNQVALVKTRPVLNAALNNPKVNVLPVVQEQVEPVEWLEKKIQADFSVAPEILRISITGDNAEELKLLVGAVREAYLNEIVNKEGQERKGRLEKLNDLYATWDETLKAKRNTLKAMALAVGSPDQKVVAARQEYKDEYVKLLRKELLNSQSEVRKAQLELVLLNAKEKTVANVSVPPEAIDALVRKDTVVERYQKHIADLEEYIAEYKRRSTQPESEGNYQDAVTKLAAANKALADRRAELRPAFEKQLRAKAREDLAASRRETEDRINFWTAAEKNLTTNYEQATKDSKTFSAQAVDLKWLQDEIVQVENVTKTIANQKQALEVELQAPSRAYKFEDPRTFPATTASSRMRMAGMAGLGAFGAVVFGIAFLEFRVRRVSRVEEVTQGLRMKLMGALPLVPKRALGGAPSAGGTYWQNQLTESVDSIRTTLMNAARLEDLRTVMVTSAVGGEGKTLLACHLAASLSRAGCKTLLIDGDLRRPAVHRLFGLPLPRGLGELLRGEAEAADITHPGAVDGLSVITAGQSDKRAVQALARDCLPELLGRLRQDYDFIIVDSAPVLPVPDSQLIGQHVDGVVLSVKRDVSRLPEVYAAYERLALLRIRVLGAVVNGLSSGVYASNYY